MADLQAAHEFVAVHGREIDLALFDFHCARGSRDAVVEALTRYQNEDGGFGHGLEPDISAPASNPFATELELSMAIDTGVSPGDPLVQRTVAYLEEAQSDDGDWHFAPEVYEHPIAPWFAGWTFPSLNPSCTLAGCLATLGLGSQRLHRRVHRLFTDLSDPAHLLGDEYYAVRPYAYYFRPPVDRPGRELYLSGVLWWLIRQNAAGRLPDTLHFFDYVHSPDSYIGRTLPTRLIATQLDALEREQSEDGGWPVAYANHWRAPSTVSAMLILKRFGRLRGVTNDSKEPTS
jgi:hypothetical protein